MFLLKGGSLWEPFEDGPRAEDVLAFVIRPFFFLKRFLFFLVHFTFSASSAKSQKKWAPVATFQVISFVVLFSRPPSQTFHLRRRRGREGSSQRSTEDGVLEQRYYEGGHHLLRVLSLAI